MRQLHTRTGFTLIEVLVSVVLVVMFSSFGIISFQRTSKTRVVENTAAKLRQTYVTARANALAGKKNCGACKVPPATGNNCLASDLPLQAWQVSLDTAAKTSTLNGVCGQTGQPDNNPGPASTRFVMDGAIIADTLPTTLTYTLTLGGGPPATNVSTLYFRPLSGGVFPNLRAAQTVTIQISDTTISPVVRRSFIVKGDGSIGPVTNP